MNILHDIEVDLTEQSILVKNPDGLYLVDTKLDHISLINQKIQSIWIRTISFLHLKSLDISNNPIKELPDIITLQILKCQNCKLSSLPLLPELKQLDCQSNQITVLKRYPKLQILNCSDNPINSINIPTLTKLTAYDCPLLSLHYTYSNRSGVFLNGKFQWKTLNCRVELKYILIDWQSSICNVKFNSKFMKKLSKFLFYTNS